jgi:hypothetical protein
MNHIMRLHLLVFIVLVSASVSAPAQAQQTAMTFFITSLGPGNGAELVGIDGAVLHCQALA